MQTTNLCINLAVGYNPPITNTHTYARTMVTHTHTCRHVCLCVCVCVGGGGVACGLQGKVWSDWMSLKM